MTVMTPADTWPSTNTTNYVRDMCPRISVEMRAQCARATTAHWRPSHRWPVVCGMESAERVIDSSFSSTSGREVDFSEV
ncbi:unnamed protein product [Litomosoides sigmodontis]|uniref:Uncharacterized protein n=1 Tax=Litomosoides sigmodontis TaxID=42156 RepID=A0A3P6T2H4_LITSI|nr:unnamed protein product [Litomosoides sigmodontis]